MANERKITDIIDQQAFDQLEKLKRELSNSQDDFLKLVNSAKELNQEISNSSSFKDLNKALEESSEKSNQVAKGTDELTKKYRKVREEQSKIIIETANSIKKQNEQTDAYMGFNAELDKTAKAQASLALEHKSLSAEIRRLQKEIIATGDETGELTEDLTELTQRDSLVNEQLKQTNLELRRRAKIENMAEDSSQRMSLVLDQLRSDYNKLTQEQKYNVDIGGRMRKEILQLDAALKESDATIGVFNRNVGNYTQASGEVVDVLTQIFPPLRLVNDHLQRGKGLYNGLTKAVKGYVNGSNDAEKGTGGVVNAFVSVQQKTSLWSKGLRVLRAAIISTGIGALIVALGALIAYLTSTQEGVDKVTRVTRPLGAAFKQIGNIAASVGKTLVEAFTSPRKALRDLLKFAKNPFKAMKEAGEQIAEGWEMGKQKDQMIKDIEEMEIAQIESSAKLRLEIEKYNSIAKDSRKSDKERAEAARKGMDLIRQRQNEQNQLLQKRIDLIKLDQEISGEASRESRKELAELEAQRLEMNAQTERRLSRFQSRENSVSKQEIDNSKEIQNHKEEEAKKIEELIKKQNELEEVRNKSNANIYRKMASDTNESLDSRLASLEQFAEKQIEIVENQFAEEERLARNKYADDLDMLEVQLDLIAERRKESEIKTAEEIASLQSQILNNSSKNESEERYKKDLKSLEESLAKREISLEEFNRKKRDLTLKYNDEILKNEIEAVEKIIEVNRSLGLDVGEAERKLAELKQQLSDQTTEHIISNLEREYEEDKKLKSKQEELYRELGNLAMSLIQGRFDKQIESLDLEKEALDQQLEDRINQIEIESETEEEARQKTAVAEAEHAAQERRIENEKRKIKQKQARADRIASIAQIIANTAIGVTGALPNIPLSIVVGAIGAASLATVLATPLPKFATGTNYSPEGWSITGEEGRELMISPDGQMSMSGDTDTLTYLQKGTKIFTADETKKILAASSIPKGDREAGTSFDLMPLINNNNNNFQKLIKSVESSKKQTGGTILTDRGIRKYSNRMSNIRKYIKDII